MPNDCDLLAFYCWSIHIDSDQSIYSKLQQKKPPAELIHGQGQGSKPHPPWPWCWHTLGISPTLGGWLQAGRKCCFQWLSRIKPRQQPGTAIPKPLGWPFVIPKREVRLPGKQFAQRRVGIICRKMPILGEQPRKGGMYCTREVSTTLILLEHCEMGWQETIVRKETGPAEKQEPS